MFQFMTATRIVFGEGALMNSLSLFNQYGYSALLVTGKNDERAQPIISYFKLQNIRYQQVAVHGEPLIAMIEEMAATGRQFKPDMVIAIGGGSVIDTGKALSALIPNQGSVYDYIEIVGRALPLSAKPLPFIAIPTTAGTGSEVTRNAVLKSAQENMKAAIRSPELLPTMAIVDPTLTYGTDRALSGYAAMDAFTHLMESYVCSDRTRSPIWYAKRAYAGWLQPYCQPARMMSRVPARIWHLLQCSVGWLCRTASLVRHTAWLLRWGDVCRSGTALLPLSLHLM